MSRRQPADPFAAAPASRPPRIPWLGMYSYCNCAAGGWVEWAVHCKSGTRDKPVFFFFVGGVGFRNACCCRIVGFSFDNAEMETGKGMWHVR